MIVRVVKSTDGKHLGKTIEVQNILELPNILKGKTRPLNQIKIKEKSITLYNSNYQVIVEVIQN